MSHLWPELLRITLCPDQIVLERGKLVISLKGVEPRYFEPEIIPVEPGHEPALWSAPLAVLGIALDGLPERPHDASVILSNHFVYYPFIHAATSLAIEPEAAGIPPLLQTALRQVLEQHHCRLTSLQPRIFTLGAQTLDEIQGEPGWLVVVEEGLACIGLIQGGEFTRLRNLCMWPVSSVELLALLDQEAAQAGLREPPRSLMLWRRDEADEVFLPLNSGWQIACLGEQRTSSVPRRAIYRQAPLNSAQA